MAFPGAPRGPLDVDSKFKGNGKVVDHAHHFALRSGTKRSQSATTPTAKMFTPATPRMITAKKGPSTIVPDGSRESIHRATKKISSQPETSLTGSAVASRSSTPTGKARAPSPTVKDGGVAAVLGTTKGLPPAAPRMQRGFSPHRNRESILFPTTTTVASKPVTSTTTATTVSRGPSPSSAPGSRTVSPRPSKEVTGKIGGHPEGTQPSRLTQFKPSSDQEVAARYKTWKDVKNMVRYKDTPKRLQETEPATNRRSIVRLHVDPSPTLDGSSLRPPVPQKPSLYRPVAPFHTD